MRSILFQFTLTSTSNYCGHRRTRKRTLPLRSPKPTTDGKAAPRQASTSDSPELPRINSRALLISVFKAVDLLRVSISLVCRLAGKFNWRKPEAYCDSALLASDRGGDSIGYVFLLRFIFLLFSGIAVAAQEPGGDVSPSAGTSYYVDSITGNDENPGNNSRFPLEKPGQSESNHFRCRR